MVAKKTSKADLSKKSFLFFTIGLSLSLMLTVMAFEFKSRDHDPLKTLGNTEDTFEKLIEIPPTAQQPPKPPKIVQPKIVEVKNDIKIKNDVDVDFSVNEDVPAQNIVIKPAEEPEEDINQLVIVGEDEPTPSGGMQAFYDYILSHLKYPSQAHRMNVEGRVYVQFVVEKDGSLTNVKAIKGIGAGCDEEAVRVVQSAPPWTPGKQRGHPVRTQMVVPIVFKLN
jgi:periplasmic protein TonB